MIIELINGERIDTFERFGITRLSHSIPSLDVSNEISAVDGIGSIITNSTYNQRIITVEFLINVRDIYSYYLLRDELNSIFVRDEYFYIIFRRESFKRYKVRLASQFNIEASINLGTFSISFQTLDRFGESVGTSIDLQNRKQTDANLWSFGSGINSDTIYNYTFDSNNFIVKNIGNQTIDPRENFLQINIRGNFNNFIEIKNNTNGDIYRFNGPITSNDNLEINGIRTLFNSNSSFRNTNMRLIRLNPGDNSFSITGGTINNIIFNFRFLYK